MEDHPSTMIARLRTGLEPARTAAARVDPARLRRVVGPGELRASAVALLLRPSERDLELLLIRRAEREGDAWSGHVGLPGGRAEELDADVVATAARETREELAIDVEGPGASELLGALPVLEPRIARAPRLSVHPFVWLVGSDVRAVPNEEVAAFRWVGLDHLRDRAHAMEHRFVGPDGTELSMPGVRIGEDVLWGITHRIVTDLFDALGE